MNEIIIYEFEKVRKDNFKKLILYLLFYFFIIILIISFLITFLYSRPKYSSFFFSIIEDPVSFFVIVTFFIVLILILIPLLIILFTEKSYSFQIKNYLFKIINKIDEFQEFTINKYLQRSSIFRDVSVFLYPSSTNYYEEDYLEIEYKNQKIELAECKIEKTESYYSGGKRRTRTITLFKGILIKIPKQIIKQNLVRRKSYFIFSIPQDPYHIYVKIDLESEFLEFNIFRKISEKDIKEKIEEISKVISIIREIVMT